MTSSLFFIKNLLNVQSRIKICNIIININNITIIIIIVVVIRIFFLSLTI